MTLRMSIWCQLHLLWNWSNSYNSSEWVERTFDSQKNILKNVQTSSPTASNCLFRICLYPRGPRFVPLSKQYFKMLLKLGFPLFSLNFEFEKHFKEQFLILKGFFVIWRLFLNLATTRLTSSAVFSLFCFCAFEKWSVFNEESLKS